MLQLTDEDRKLAWLIALKYMSKPILLENLAEECSELSHAALKLSRCLRGENPTPVTLEEAESRYLEEACDVLVVLSVLGFEPDPETVSKKLERWHKRLVERDILFADPNYNEKDL